MTTQTTTVRARRSLPVSGLAYVALTLVLFFGTIQIAQYVGLWSVSGKLTAQGAPVALTGADPAEIKGWMSIQQVLDAYPVDQAALYERFGIPANTPPSTPLKELEDLAPDFSVTDLRVWVAEQPTP